MRFWTREVAGWLLIILGLYLFYRCYTLITGPSHYIIEGGMLTVVGVFLFRGGIHLLKVAVAADICLTAEEQEQGKRAAGRQRDTSRPLMVRSRS
jgi:hypothetical protein